MHERAQAGDCQSVRLASALNVICRRVVAKPVEQDASSVYCRPFSKVRDKYGAKIGKIERFRLNRYAKRAQSALVKQQKVQCGFSPKRVCR
eukprot:IDg10823t1